MSKVTILTRPNRIVIASKGVQGPPGPEGEQGIQGPKGDTGDVTPEALAARDEAQEAATTASTAAGTATGAATAASGSASAAAASANLAEQARLLGATIGFATKADMDASLAHPDGTLALVTSDATAANNGTYRKTGASGSGAWVQSADRVTGLEQALNTQAAKLIEIRGRYTNLAGAIAGGVQVGEVYYRPIPRDLFRITAITGPTTGSVVTVPYVSGAIYTLDEELYIYDGYELVRANKQLADQLDALAYRLIRLVSFSDLAGAISSGAEVGDVYYNPTLSSAERGLYRITAITGPTTGSTIRLPFIAGAIYTFDNDLYVADGTRLVKAGQDEAPGVDAYLIKLTGMGSLGGGNSGVTEVGDIYYHPVQRKLFRVVTLTSPTTGTTEEVPYVDGAIYTFNNELYVYDGYRLVKTTDGLAAPFDQKIELKGERKLVREVPDDVIASYINGIKFADELEDHITELTKEGDNFAHTPAFLIDDGIVYAIFMVNYIGQHETPTELSIRMQSFPLSDPTDMTYYDVCDIGDVHLGKSVVKNYDSAIFMKDGLLYLLWNSELSGDGFYTMLYRTFDPVTAVMSESQECMFKVGATVNSMNVAGMNAAFVSGGVNIPPLAMHSHIVLMPRVTPRVEGGVTYYYTGIGSTGRANFITKTADFVTWEYVAHPPFENMAQYEPAVYVIGDFAYYFCRQNGPTTGFLTKYNIATDVWDTPVFIDDAQSRSEFLHHGSRLYLIKAPKDRNHISIMRINTSEPERSYEVQVARVSGTYAYPVSQEYGGELYMLFSDNKSRMYLSKFTIASLSVAAVKDKFREIFWP